ncbi:hypothetical protein M406DRAFT_71478 [Cryphonectria parasitica EP155]|uniref:Myb-like domain-containing protein n=1 Tax=Cryphonectria parasitica (strain ATCC 38755 / EP155) TaxID=660469 RepID=A0A9P4Y7N5_CRYP1|nr:uncharacterized protein M406DRAFT_71478 [Cryphonectria parasitica EP155]KAF3768474.1 hypothetical protein M406DRAFT_71478 [Cryphonectria parasitica EP155]
MPPKGRGGRAAAAAAAAATGGGRTSSRLASRLGTAQQQAERQPAGSAADTGRAPLPDSSAAAAAAATADLPPSSSSTRGRGRSRSRGNVEAHARRGTTRNNRGGSSIASYSIRHTARSSDVYALEANGGASEPFTPQRAEAAEIVYGESIWRDAADLTPRTQDATANLMNKFVDRLFSVSKDLIGHLSIAAEQQDESWDLELRTHKEVFNSFYRVYNIDADIFINIDSILERSKCSNIPTLWERMVKSVSTANLAKLLSDVHDLNGDRSNVLNRLPLLQRIDEDFPVTFTPGGSKGLEENRAWIIDHGTMDQAFAIRTKLFIETLRGHQQGNPFRLFAKVFLDLDADPIEDDVLGDYIDRASYRAFGAFDIDDPELPKYRDNINTFRAMLVEMDPAAVIGKLEGHYPFEIFLDDLNEWIRTYQIKTPGPPRPPPFNPNADTLSTPGTASQLGARPTLPQGSTGLYGVDRLRQHVTSSNAEQPGEVHARMDSGAHVINDSDDSASIAGTNAEVIAQSRELAAQARYFMPTSQESVYPDVAAEATKRGNGKKRSRKSADDIEADASAKRARANDAAAMPPPPRPAAHAVPVSSSAPSPAVFDPVALSRQSQLISKANRRPSQPKQRKPWTSHDISQLVRAIDVYKAKWSTIEKAIRDNHLHFNVPERDQQGLRDKARLVKVDILKTDGPLPAAFDLVVLGRKEKEMVIAAGRNPERREEDLDEDGHPNNLFYTPNLPRPVQDVNPVPPPQAHTDINGNDGTDHGTDIGHASAMHEEAPVMSGALPVSSETTDLRPLQEASMVVEAPMGEAHVGIPEAPMPTADMSSSAAPLSESLGEEQSVVDNEAPPVDPSITEAVPSSAAVHG